MPPTGSDIKIRHASRRNSRVDYNKAMTCKESWAMYIECEHDFKCFNKNVSDWLCRRERIDKYSIKTSKLGYKYAVSAQNIKKGDIVIANIMDEQVDQNPMIYQIYHEESLYEMNGDMKIFNHSCRPNMILQMVYVKDKLYAHFKASKRIQPEMELTINYHCDIKYALGKIVCECGAYGCARFIRGEFKKNSHGYGCSFIGCTSGSRKGKKGKCILHSKQ